MTNTSAQTMLGPEEIARKILPCICSKNPMADCHTVHCPGNFRKAMVAALRAASAPAAVRELLQKCDQYIRHNHNGGLGWWNDRTAYALVEGIKAALATPEEASSAAGEAETTEQIVQRVKEACAQVADRFVVRDLEYGAIRPDDMVAAEHRAERGRSIAGAIRALIPAAQTDGVREARPLPKNFNEQFVIFRLQAVLAPLMKIQRTYGEGDGTQATSSLFLAEDGRKVTVTVRID